MKKIKTPTIPGYIEKIGMIWLGVSLMAVGFAFAILPFLPGWIFIVPGLSILSKYSSTIANLRITNFTLRYYEKNIINNRYLNPRKVFLNRKKKTPKLAS